MDNDFVIENEIITNVNSEEELKNIFNEKLASLIAFTKKRMEDHCDKIFCMV